MMSNAVEPSPFVICIDGNPAYLRSAMVLIKSISDKTPNAEVLLVTAGVSENKLAAVRSWGQGLERKSGLHLETIDGSDLPVQGLPIEKENPFGYTPAIFMRLHLPAMLERNFVYLDADCLALEDLTPVRYIDPGDNCVSSVQHPYYPTIGHQSQLAKLLPARYHGFAYGNSAVSSVNARQWIGRGITEKCVEFMTNGTNGKPLRFPDQDAMTAVLALEGIRFESLPPEYNVPTITELAEIAKEKYPDFVFPDLATLRELETRAAILHPPGRPKFEDPEFPGGTNLDTYREIATGVPGVREDGRLVFASSLPYDGLD